jgi:hypothetical protein
VPSVVVEAIAAGWLSRYHSLMVGSDVSILDWFTYFV